jgi:hypothetical protein
MAHLTNAQLLTLKAAILNETDPTFVALRNASDEFSMAAWFNENTSPAFIVWKSSVTIRDTGQAFNGAEWAGMTSANHTRLQTVAQYLASYNPASAGIRAMFDDIWSGAGGTNTRAALLALWKRTARRYEKLYATGTGSDASPATLVIEGAIDSSHITEALEAV